MSIEFGWSVVSYRSRIRKLTKVKVIIVSLLNLFLGVLLVEGVLAKDEDCGDVVQS